MTRRELIPASALGAAFAARPAGGAEPVVNGAEHAWVLHDRRFPIDPELATCTGNLPKYEYSAEHILADMRTHQVDHVVISHVCYYGRDNRYPAHILKTYPGKFAAIGLLVGHRLYRPNDQENAGRLERLMKEDGFIGLRLSPIYDPDVVWLNDPVCYSLWKKAEELGGTFNIFLAPHQIGQVGDMAARFPGVNVVIDHMAMIDIARPASEGIEPLVGLAKYPNVYARTSLHNPSKTKELPFRDVWPYLRRLYDAFGPRRLVYANFHELMIMKELIPFFAAEDKQWILGRTARRLYGFGRG
ncbi:MAG: amidohydrolase [Acidobacteriia bacterium]|nr:amidohydrolase [Terriglobia bacterium]